jgi:hypothetical protein
VKTPVHQLLDIVIAASETSDLYVTPSQYDFLHKVCWKYRNEPLPIEIKMDNGDQILIHCRECGFKHTREESCLR